MTTFKVGWLVYHAIAGQLYIHNLVSGNILQVQSACVNVDTRDGHLEPSIYPCKDYVVDEVWKHYAECTKRGCILLRGEYEN